MTTGATRRLETPGALGALRHGLAPAPDGRTLAAIARSDVGPERLVLLGEAVMARELWSAPRATQIRLVGWLGDGSSLFVTQQAPLPRPPSHRELLRRGWYLPRPERS